MSEFLLMLGAVMIAINGVITAIGIGIAIAMTIINWIAGD